MSTQDENGIPFVVDSEQQQFRFLELPPSLLDLLTSKRLSNLTLKSASPSLSGQPTPNAVLCTDSQTYHVRQVQSSNSVFVLQPTETWPENGSIPLINLSAIAQCNTTLELVPAPPSAIKFLKQHLPAYTGPQSMNESTAASLPSERTGRTALLQNAPFSAGEFDNACKELCVFEENSQAWVPTASIVASVWKSMILAATVKNIDLASGFLVTALSGAIEEDDFPLILFEAVLERLSFVDADRMEGYAALSRGLVVPWLGANLLESQCAATGGLLKSQFLQDWQNQLPEAWKEYATLDALKGSFSDIGEGRIVFDQSEVKPTGGSIHNKGDGRNARKWHEKFKNARR